MFRSYITLHMLDSVDTVLYMHTITNILLIAITTEKH